MSRYADGLLFAWKENKELAAYGLKFDVNDKHWLTEYMLGEGSK